MTAPLRDLVLHYGLVGGSDDERGISLWGLALAGKAGGKGPGRVGWLLVNWPLTAGCLLPPHPTRTVLSLTVSLHHS